MRTVFGNENQDLRNLVTTLVESTSAICNESAGVSSTEVATLQDTIRDQMIEHYSASMTEGALENILKNDAEMASQIFANSLVEQCDGKSLTEASGSGLNIVTLTSSIATTMRTPYEATMHRMYDTMVVDKQTVEIEEVIPTIKAPGSETSENLIDALAPNAPVMFVDKTEIILKDLGTTGVANNAKNIALLKDLNPLYRVNRDMRLTKIDAVENDGKTPIPAARIHIKKGSVPYFDAKTLVMTALYELTLVDNSIIDIDVNAKMNFQTGVLEYARADEHVTKMYFYACISHEEHTHPITTGFENRFQQYTVPTRPHIEVSMPMETETDIGNTISHFSDINIITAMTDNISVISSRLEDQRLVKGIMEDSMFTAEFSYEFETGFAHGYVEWFKREFVPFLDQVAVKMKTQYNIEDCHFRVAVSPYVIRLIDTDYTTDKSASETNKGSGAINNTIGIKTSTSVFYLISSQMIPDNKLRVNLLPNNFKNSQVKTFAYFKYSSFLTDKLRSTKNPTRPAIVYSERNLPIVFTPVTTDLTITNMPIAQTSGKRFVKFTH